MKFQRIFLLLSSLFFVCNILCGQDKQMQNICNINLNLGNQGFDNNNFASAKTFLKIYIEHCLLDNLDKTQFMPLLKYSKSCIETKTPSEAIEVQSGVILIIEGFEKNGQITEEIWAKSLLLYMEFGRLYYFRAVCRMMEEKNYEDAINDLDKSTKVFENFLALSRKTGNYSNLTNMINGYITSNERQIGLAFYLDNKANKACDYWEKCKDTNDDCLNFVLEYCQQKNINNDGYYNTTYLKNLDNIAILQKENCGIETRVDGDLDYVSLTLDLEAVCDKESISINLEKNGEIIKRIHGEKELRELNQDFNFDLKAPFKINIYYSGGCRLTCPYDHCIKDITTVLKLNKNGYTYITLKP